MIQKAVTKLLKHRHPWRELEFSQLAELYSSVTMRMIAISLVGLFIPVYLYKTGYSVPEVLWFFVLTYLATTIFKVLAGFVVARYGPKHTLLASNLAQVAALLLLVDMGNRVWPLALPATIYGLARALYFVAYNVDFSKILHPDHGGKELGFMTNLKKLAGVLGPLIGGMIAFLFGARYTLIVGIALFALAAVPLFFSSEPVRTHQKLNFKGLFARRRIRDYVAYTGLSSQQRIIFLFFPLFLTITIFSTNTYAKLGLVTSIGTAIGLASTTVIGRLVDKNRGGLLLKYGSVGVTIIHLLRGLVTGFGGVVAVIIANQSISSTYLIPFSRGYYDVADSLRGQRIAYVTMMETIAEVGNLILAVIVWLLSLVVLPSLALQASFILAAGFTLLMLLQNFPALAPRYHLPFKQQSFAVKPR